MPKRYYIFKWLICAAAVLLLLGLDVFLFRYLRLWGVVPFLPPMIVGVVSAWEGSKASPFFALAFGLFCDIAMLSPAPGFFAVVFTAAAVLTSPMAEQLFSPGLLCAAVSTLITYLLTAAGRILVLLTAGTGALGEMAWLALRELIVSLPLLLVVFPVIRWVHRRTTFDY